MDCLGFRFYIIGLTETWVKMKYALYGIEGYELLENIVPPKPRAVLSYSLLKK